MSAVEERVDDGAVGSGGVWSPTSRQSANSTTSTVFTPCHCGSNQNIHHRWYWTVHQQDRHLAVMSITPSKPLKAFISFPSPYTQTLLLQALVSSLPSLSISLVPPEDDDPPALQWYVGHTYSSLDTR
jgi:hypothetical protein